LKENGVAEAAAQARRFFQRRFDRHVVHARLQNTFEILV